MKNQGVFVFVIVIIRSKLCLRPRDYDIFHRFPQLGRYIGAFLTFRGSLLWRDASMHLNPSTNLLSILISSEPECTCHLLSSPRAGNNIVYHPSQCHSFSLPFLYFFLYIILFSNHYEVLFFRSITFLYYTYTFPFFFLLHSLFFSPSFFFFLSCPFSQSPISINPLTI